ncbi:MAG TPA: YwpF-like family protein [Bacillaceae bacterium]
MKTFKIVALQMIEDQNIKDIPLEDGLIINKENEDATWIIEALVDDSYEEYFHEYKEKKEPSEIRVIITHAANDPAPFTVKVHSISRLTNHISVLFKGKLSKRRNEYAEMLLDDLIKEGYGGEELLKEFQNRMVTKQPVSRMRRG